MENKNITNTAKLILYIWNIGLFALVWVCYYNTYTFQSFLSLGAIVSCIIHGFIYSFLCNLYQAFRIASTEITDTAFSQTIAFGVADLILYVECCLIYNQYVNILPGVATVLVQISGTIAIIYVAKRYMVTHIVPRKTLLLYGKHVTREEAEFFVQRLMRKYRHLFNVTRIEFDRMSRKELSVILTDCEAVLLYEVSNDVRGKFMKLCTEEKKVLYFTPKIEDILCQGSVEKNLLDTPLMKYEYQYDSQRGYIGKRALDLFMSSFLLILLAPVMLITAIAIKVEDGGPILFKQKRVGLQKMHFNILKFRTMRIDTPKDMPTHMLSNPDQYITKVGKFLRKSSLDELPQILNILKGEMSIIGPRPALWNQYDLIEERDKYGANDVLPGLTGWAQINGRDELEIPVKAKLDGEYVEKFGPVMDIKCFFGTITAVLFHKGVVEGGTGEMKKKS